MDVGLRATALLFETAANTLERIEQVEQEAAFAFGLSFDIGLGFTGAFGSWLNRTGFSRLDHDIARRGNNEPPGCRFRRPQNAEHMAVEWLCNPLDAATLGQPDLGEQLRDDAKSGTRQRSMAKFLSMSRH